MRSNLWRNWRKSECRNKAEKTDNLREIYSCVKVWKQLHKHGHQWWNKIQHLKIINWFHRSWAVLLYSSFVHVEIIRGLKPCNIVFKSDFHWKVHKNLFFFKSKRGDDDDAHSLFLMRKVNAQKSETWRAVNEKSGNLIHN